MEQQVDQKQQMLKRIVIILGVLIVIAVIVLVVGIIRKTSGGGSGTVSSDAGPAFGEISITMPANSRVAATNVTPSEIHALMLTPFGQRLIVIDRATGQQLGIVKFTPDRAPAR